MTDSPTTVATRILVALDASRQSRCTLEIAASLAARRKAELLALFIEDVNLIHLAGLPFAREIDRISASERQFDAPVMSRGLRTQLHLIRQLLAQVTQDTTLNTSLKILRGHYVAEAISAATEMDILFLGRSRDAEPREPPDESAAAKRYSGIQPPVSRPVWVLFDGTPAAARALAIANDLAAAEQKQLLIVLQATTAEKSCALKQQAIAALEAPHSPPRAFSSTVPTEFSPLQYLTSPPSETGALLRSVRHKGCSLMVINREQAQQLNHTLKILIEELNCPVVLAG
jgi:nucleotide-binding universal stress UspA family protein